MRNIVAGLLLFAAVAASAQSGAPLHHAGKVVKNRYHRVGHNVRATGHYIGHKVRGVKKAIKN